ncbi:hypothetical protein VTN00DRAFT_5329 [Thermoascus crustaceus]|uniref:uncharacterized protein n=1 Tax=Thermoascus crustaceus TaxID=5088 RepID=UPI00374490E6
MLVGRSERAPVVGSHSRRRTSGLQQDEHGKADDVHEALTKILGDREIQQAEKGRGGSAGSLKALTWQKEEKGSLNRLEGCVKANRQYFSCSCASPYDKLTTVLKSEDHVARMPVGGGEYFAVSAFIAFNSTNVHFGETGSERAQDHEDFLYDRLVTSTTTTKLSHEEAEWSERFCILGHCQSQLEATRKAHLSPFRLL